MIREIKEERIKELKPLVDEQTKQLEEEKKKFEEEKKILEESKKQLEEEIKNIDYELRGIEFSITVKLPKEEEQKWDKLYIDAKKQDKTIDTLQFLLDRKYIRYDSYGYLEINMEKFDTLFKKIKYHQLIKTIKKYIVLLNDKKSKENDIQIKEEKIAKKEEKIAEEEEEEKIAKVADTIPQIKEIKSKKTLRDLGLTLEQAIQYLKERKIPIVLREEDKVITERHEVFDSFDKLVGIHKTDYMPRNGVIYTPSEAGKKRKVTKYKFRGRNIELEADYIRDTIHVCMNGEVTAHLDSWDKCKYMVIIPMSKIPKGKIISALPADTYLDGSLKLPEGSWILCPIEEIEEIQKANPGIKVLGYEGKPLGYGNAFITMLGYEHRPTGKYEWSEPNDREKSDDAYNELMTKHNIEIFSHWNSESKQKEEQAMKINNIEEYLIHIATYYSIRLEDINDIINESGLKIAFDEGFLKFDNGVNKICNEEFKQMIQNLERRGIIITEEDKTELNKIIEDLNKNIDYVMEKDLEILFKAFIKAAVKAIIIAQQTQRRIETIDEVPGRGR